MESRFPMQFEAKQQESQIDTARRLDRCTRTSRSSLSRTWYTAFHWRFDRKFFSRRTRSTMDVDVVCDLTESQAVPFVSRFNADFYISQTAFDAVLVSKGIDDVVAMPNAARENQYGVAVGRVFDDLRLHGFNQRFAIHESFDLVDYEFTSANVERAKVDLLFARLRDQWTQKPIADQFLDSNLVTDRVDNVFRGTDITVLESKRCGCKPDDAQVRVHLLGIREELLVHSLSIGTNKVRLIDNDQIEPIKLTGTLIDRLDAGDDDGIVGVATLQTCRVDTEVYLGADCG